MLLTEFETTVVIRPDISGEAVEATLDKVRDSVKNGGGKLLAVNHWGKKRLAYDIAKQGRGIYVHTQYLGPSDLVAEVERNLRISDNVLRFLTVKVAGDVNPSEREEKAYVKPQYDAAAEDEEELQAKAEDETSDEAFGGGDDEGDESVAEETEE